MPITSNLSFKAPENPVLKPIITVFGVGGAGGNAVNNMISAHLQGANFVVANTDAQSLEHSLCENRIQLGVELTQGLGAGAAPEIGAAAAEESVDEIREYLKNSNMVFITAGMGGGTGTGAGPFIAKIAKELGILTVGVVTTPFDFEGGRRREIALSGLTQLYKHVDTLIVIPNQNLFRIANERTTLTDAFKMADDVLHAGVRGVTDLMIMPGLINLDFADIRTVMSEMGKAMMGTGEASGEDRAIKAAEAAISNPLLDHNSMKGARGVLINITGGNDMTLFEVDSAANRIRNEVGYNGANIIFGSTFNPALDGIIRVSVVATGIDAENDKNNAKSSFSTTENEVETKIAAKKIIEEEVPTFGEYDLQNHDNAPSQDENTEANNLHKADHEKPIINNDLYNYPQIKPIETNLANPPAKLSNQTQVSKPNLLSKMWRSLTRDEKSNNQDSNNYVNPKVDEHLDEKNIPTVLRKPKS